MLYNVIPYGLILRPRVLHRIELMKSFYWRYWQAIQNKNKNMKTLYTKHCCSFMGILFFITLRNIMSVFRTVNIILQSQLWTSARDVIRRIFSGKKNIYISFYDALKHQKLSTNDRFRRRYASPLRYVKYHIVIIHI